MSSGRGMASQGLTLTLFIIGVVLLAGGLIFLCAAVNNIGRMPIALALLVIGGGLAAWAGIRWRQAREISPDVLDDRITNLASAHDGETTLSQVISELNVPDDAARTALARLEAEGRCRQERREDRIFYVFPGLKESRVIRRCSYCGNEYSVREPLHKCPNCGGNLEVVKI
jgi:hypothetical protein